MSKNNKATKTIKTTKPAKTVNSVKTTNTTNTTGNKSSSLDLKVELYDYRAHDPIKRGRLQLLCSGEDCNEQFINGIGRIATERLPMYAYANDLIKIEKINPESGYHDSVGFNHDMMRLRLKNTPVMNVDPGFAILHERYWKNVDYRDPNREKHEKEKRIEVYIDAKNTAPEDSTEIMHVTTNDSKIYIDDEQVQIYDKDYPLLIISLNPKEAFRCSMKAVFGLGINDSSWFACSNFCYDQETIPGKLIAKFMSASQFDEFTLIDRSLEYYKNRAEILKSEINRMYLLDDDHTTRFMIKINDEDHTMGESICYEIQSHKDIKVASVTKPDLLVNSIIINVYASNKDTMLDAIMESIDNLITKIDHFKNEFEKIDRSKLNINTDINTNTNTNTKSKSKSKSK